MNSYGHGVGVPTEPISQRILKSRKLPSLARSALLAASRSTNLGLPSCPMSRSISAAWAAHTATPSSITSIFALFRLLRALQGIARTREQPISPRCAVAKPAKAVVVTSHPDL